MKKNVMKKNVNILVYGEFKKGDVRLKVMKHSAFQYQNVLQSMGYDCELYSEEIEFEINDEDMED